MILLPLVSKLVGLVKQWRDYDILLSKLFDLVGQHIGFVIFDIKIN